MMDCKNPSQQSPATPQGALSPEARIGATEAHKATREAQRSRFRHTPIKSWHAEIQKPSSAPIPVGFSGLGATPWIGAGNSAREFRDSHKGGEAKFTHHGPGVTASSWASPCSSRVRARAVRQQPSRSAWACSWAATAAGTLIGKAAMAWPGQR